MGKLDCSEESTPIGPRERLLQFGEHRLSDVECLSLVLRKNGRRTSVEQSAQDLLRTFGGLADLSIRGIREIERCGVGPVSAAALVAAFGLARRIAEESVRPGTYVRHGGDVAKVVQQAARGSRRENFFIILLDVRRRVMGMHLVSTGIVDSALVHPREVFGPAVRDAAVSLVLAHNHPSGDPSPSAQDHEVTERLKRVGGLLGIEVVDHIIVGTESYYSFAEGDCYLYR